MVNEDRFENLARLGYERTSEPDEAYNCFAYAAGVTNEWWDPLGVWPEGVARDDRVESLIEVYRRHGFELCEPDATAEGFEKLAIYSLDGSFQHAAKLLSDGRWASKLGPDDDIAHGELAALEGSLYGQVTAYLRRPASL